MGLKSLPYPPLSSETGENRGWRRQEVPTACGDMRPLVHRALAAQPYRGRANSCCCPMTHDRDRRRRMTRDDKPWLMTTAGDRTTSLTTVHRPIIKRSSDQKRNV